MMLAGALFLALTAGTALAMHGPFYGTGGPDSFSGSPGDDLVYGYGGDDRLAGSTGNDRIFGGAGDDRVLGGRGNDELRGGPGEDMLRGGAGSDEIYAVDGERDVIDCGGGNLDGVGADEIDVVVGGCEVFPPPVPVRGG